MRVLITGGAGYIGIELAYRLAALNETTEVVIYDSLSRSSANVFTGLRKFPAGKVSFVEADLLDSPSLLARIKNADCLFHLAAVVPAANHAQSPHFFEQINNWGAGVLVDAIERSARDLRVIYLSSFEVLPYGVVDPLSELTTPSNHYGLSKLRGERHFYRLRDATNCEVSIVRTPTVFGYSKNLRVDLSINRLVFDAYFKNKVMVRGEDEINCYVPMTSLIDSLIKKLKLRAQDNLISVPPLIETTSVYIEECLVEIFPKLERLYVDQKRYESRRTLNQDFFNGEPHLRIPEGELVAELRDFCESFTLM